MKALRLYGPSKIQIDDIPIPTIREQELLLKIDSCSICGSDFRNVRAGGSSHGMDLPRVLGHELVGTIVEVGAQWRDQFHEGEQVVVGAIVPCGRCPLCIQGHPNQCQNKKAIAYQYDGAFAEYMKVPEQSIRSGNVIKVAEHDEAMRPQLALSEPLSCAINGQEISQVSLTDTIVIVGCGPLGLFHTQLAKLKGCSKIICVDFDQHRLHLAKQVGADHILSPQEVDLEEAIKELTNGIGASVVMVAVPDPQVVQNALNWVAPRGRINVFGGMPQDHQGIELNLNIIHYQEITIQGTSDSTPKHLHQAMELILTDRVRTDFMITKKITLEEAKEVLLQKPDLKQIKYVVIPEAN